MRAVLVEKFGGPEDLTIGDAPAPELTRGAVRVAVKAAALNFADTLLIAGKYQVRPEPPFSPGLELAGEVVEVADDVTGIAAGTRVMAVVDYGAFAEEAVIPAGDVYPIPDMMDFETAAAFPVAYGTSHVALTERTKLEPGETLLVHGAAGGVGLTAVEIGHVLGAQVIATASSADKLAVAREYGADHLIDYSHEDVIARVKEITGGRGADVHYDPVGGDAFKASLRTVPWGGRILVIGFAGGDVPQIPANILLVKNVAAIGFYWGSYREHAPEIVRQSFAELLGWYAAGKLKPRISHTFPLDEAAAALKTMLARKSSGKIVLDLT